MRSCPPHATAQQLLQQRVAHGLRTHLHAGGVDHALHFQLQRPAPAVHPCQAHARTFGHGGLQAAAMQLQAALPLHFQQLRMQRGGDAVPMYVPVAHHMAQEAPLVVGRQALPQGLAQRPDALHYALPRNAPHGRVGGMLAQGMQALAQVHHQQRSGVVVGRCALGMRQRQQRMPRHHVDAPTVAVGLQRGHRISHAQAGADDRHVGCNGNIRQRSVIPGLDALGFGQAAGTTRRQGP